MFRKKFLQRYFLAAIICIVIMSSLFPGSLIKASNPTVDVQNEKTNCTHIHDENCTYSVAHTPVCVHEHQEACYTVADTQKILNCIHVCNNDCGESIQQGECLHTHGEACSEGISAPAPEESDDTMLAKQEADPSESTQALSMEIAPAIAPQTATVVSNYDELVNAISGAQDGVQKEILLGQDIATNKMVSIPVGKNIQIDLGGKAIINSNNCVFLVDGILTLTGEGTVTGHENAAVWVQASAEFFLSGNVCISDSTGSYAGGIYNVGITTLSGGRIEDCTAASGYSGGIYNGGTLYFYAGTIARCVGRWGGGVFNTGTMQLSGGRIVECSASQLGGGIYNNDVLEIYEGEVNNNTVPWYGGGVYNAATLKIYGGEISANIADDYGAGIYTDGETIIEGGIFERNSTKSYGAAIYIDTEGNLIINDGIIRKNMQPSSNDGGIIHNLGTLTLNDAIIEDNTVQFSLNAAIANEGAFIMNGGAVRRNNAYGVLNEYECSFTMNGGTITKNNIGVYTLRRSTFIMRGGAVYANNNNSSSATADIRWAANMQTLPEDLPTINVMPASMMIAEGHTFSGWKNAFHADEPEVTGELTQANNVGRYGDTYNAVITTSPGPETDGIFLDGQNGNDDNDGLTLESAVKTFEKAKQLLQEHELWEKIYICGTVTVNAAVSWSLETGQQLVRFSEFTDILINVGAAGKLTLTNIAIDGNKSNTDAAGTGSLVSVTEGELILEDNAVLRNNRQKRGLMGSAIHANRARISIVGDAFIIDNHTFGNAAGILVDNHSTLVMRAGEIARNETAESGGGVLLIRGSNMEMVGGKIANNNAWKGGGIDIGSERTDLLRPTSKLTMKGGSITGNTAIGLGGGIYVQDENIADIMAGTISGNHANGDGNHTYAGGGIYINGGRLANGQQYGDGILYLHNVLITENRARGMYGGGIAACPTAYTQIYITQGAAIFNNEASAAQQIYATSTDKNSPTFVSDYMLGGGMYNWYWAEAGEEQTPAKKDQYQNTTSAIRLDNRPDASAIKKAETLADVYIIGNSSGTYGGGIGSNGTVIIGDAPTYSLVVNKEWQNDMEEERPDSITLHFYINEYEIREVILTKEAGWTATLSDFPEQVWAQPNDIKVTVQEEDIAGYILIPEVQVDAVARKITVDLKNVKFEQGDGRLQIKKVVTGDGDITKRFNFTVWLCDAAGKELTESFPYIGTGINNGEITSGQTIQLAHEEAIEIYGLPEGTQYEVIEVEADADGYETWVENNQGVVVAEAVVNVVFTNSKKDEQVSPVPSNPEVETLPSANGEGKKTGDKANVEIWIVLLLLGINGAAYLIYKKISKKQ